MSDVPGILRRAVPYGLATVDLHRILVNFALDPTSPEFKAPLNQISHSRRIADPSDLSVVNLNVDTPYSYAWLDLRTGPVLITMPPHGADRYMSAQLFDTYSYIVGYVSPRTRGSEGGTFVVRGPSARAGDVFGDGSFDCPTDLCLVLIRTQLFDDEDMPNVAALQDAVVIEPLGAPAPALDPPAVCDVRHPLDEGFVRVLDWMLGLMPRLPEDAAIRDDLDAVGIGRQRWIGAADTYPRDEVLSALEQGRQDVLARCATVRSSAELFGDRAHFAGDHLSRAAGAYLGILGNSAEEYLGVGYPADSEGRPFDGAHRYVIRFLPGMLPPVGAFWSITLYDADQHLYANELERYVIGSRQLETLERDADGGLTLHIGHSRPEGALVSNWLPAPRDAFGLTFRTYLPGEAIRTGEWTAPPVIRID